MIIAQKKWLTLLVAILCMCQGALAGSEVASAPLEHTDVKIIPIPATQEAQHQAVQVPQPTQENKKPTPVSTVQNHNAVAAKIKSQSEINSGTSSSANTLDDDGCAVVRQHNTLRSGWYNNTPYQFVQHTMYGRHVKGMDIEIVQALVNKIDMNVTYEEMAWHSQQDFLKDGILELSAGATYAKSREDYAYFSSPYRYETDSLFTLVNNYNTLSFKNVQEFLSQVRLKNYKLGVIKEYIYADDDINKFIVDPANSDIIVFYTGDTDALDGVLHGEVDGYMTDRVVGASLIMNDIVAANKVKEVPLNISVPVHLILSKKSVSSEIVFKINAAIEELVTSERYKKIVCDYLYPVMLMQTINADWFYYVSIIGTIAFALSGVAIALECNMTLFGAMFMALLPSVGGGVLRDIMLSRDYVGITITPVYVYFVIMTVMLAFATIRVLNVFNKDTQKDSEIMSFWKNTFVVSDAIGQAAFVVTGVTVAVATKVEPIELWGPFCAFITANVGGILRDVVRGGGVRCFNGEINAEVSIIWGFLLSMFLKMHTSNPSSDTIALAVVVTIVGVFVTRLVSYYLKWNNIRFSPKVATVLVTTDQQTA